MATSPKEFPHQRMNLRVWPTLIVIYVVAGAILGSPGRGPISKEDISWQKWAAIVALWSVYGAMIGAMTFRRTGQSGSYLRAMVLFAIFMSVFSLIVEFIRVMAAWYIGGWKWNATSVGIGALVGVISCPFVILLFEALSKIFALMFPLTATEKAPNSGSPG